MDVSQLQIPGLAASNSSAADSKQSKTASAAQQFEALLIGEMLKSVREGSDDGWLGGGSDSSAETAFGMAENQFAQTIAAKGGFGLAKTVQHAIEREDAAHKPRHPSSTKPASSSLTSK
jgi:Rod binding domain-containing protein